MRRVVRPQPALRATSVEDGTPSYRAGWHVRRVGVGSVTTQMSGPLTEVLSLVSGTIIGGAVAWARRTQQWVPVSRNPARTGPPRRDGVIASRQTGPHRLVPTGRPRFWRSSRCRPPPGRDSAPDEVPQRPPQRHRATFVASPPMAKRYANDQFSENLTASSENSSSYSRASWSRPRAHSKAAAFLRDVCRYSRSPIRLFSSIALVSSCSARVRLASSPFIDATSST